MIVDDEASVRQIIRLILEREQRFAVQAECVSGEHALQALEQALPQVVLMDIRMPGLDGLECTLRIRQRFPAVRVVMVTGCGQAELLTRALSAGAVGYLLKPFQPAEVLAAVEHALAGRFVLEAQAFARLQEGMGLATAEEPPIFTGRERQVLSGLECGSTNSEIAFQLGISEYSVKEHLKRLFKKLGAVSRAHAVSLARRSKDERSSPPDAL
jgi:DNA-binding NarL/FixJ family response regulator